LDDLRQRGEANGLADLELLAPEAMREIEPRVAGVRALKVPSTGITDYAQVARKYAEIAVSRGAELKTGAGVVGFRNSTSETVIQTRAGDFPARYVVNCAGLYSDRIARLAGHDPEIMIVPFRGEYYDLIESRAGLVRNLIYPVPDPRFPFLGVHFTRRISGTVDAGPNAVLALRREGYKRTDFNLGEAMATLTYRGFRSGDTVWRSIGARCKKAPSYVRCSNYCRRFAPRIWCRADRACGRWHWRPTATWSMISSSCPGTASCTCSMCRPRQRPRRCPSGEKF
jgi:L-2-hydroxyglutarate oxidase